MGPLQAMLHFLGLDGPAFRTPLSLPLVTPFGTEASTPGHAGLPPGQLRVELPPGHSLNQLADQLSVALGRDPAGMRAEVQALNPGLDADQPLMPGQSVQLSSETAQHLLALPAAGASPDDSRELPPSPPLGRLPPSPGAVLAAPLDSRGDAVLAYAPAAPTAAAPAWIAAFRPAPGPAADTAMPAAIALRVGASALGASQAAAVAALAGIQQAHESQALPPPPPQWPWLEGRSGTLPVSPASAQTGWSPAPPEGAWQISAVAADGSQAKLQLLAMLVAQMGAPVAAGAGMPAQGQPPGFIDPQAVAAQAASLRAGRTIDLGAGRTLEFTLVADRMRRVDAVGQDANEDAARRAARQALSAQAMQRAEAGEQAGRGEEETAWDEQRRRRAAIAAERRRRRPASRRCRYRRGRRYPLQAGRYPPAVDWTEFRGRRPPRYPQA